MTFVTEPRRANESRILQVEFLVCPPNTFGSLGRFTTTSGVFLLFAYQIAIIDMSRSIMFGVDGSSWLSEYRGIPFMGRTGYLSELTPEELRPWSNKVDKVIASKYLDMFEQIEKEGITLSMEDFDIEDYAQNFETAKKLAMS